MNIWKWPFMLSTRKRFIVTFTFLTTKDVRERRLARKSDFDYGLVVGKLSRRFAWTIQYPLELHYIPITIDWNWNRIESKTKIKIILFCKWCDDWFNHIKTSMIDFCFVRVRSPLRNNETSDPNNVVCFGFHYNSNTCLFTHSLFRPNG